MERSAVLCADDITPDTREWVSEIHKFFEGGHKQTVKAKILKAFYGKLDTDYTTKTGDYLYILAGNEGLTFETEGQQFTASYGSLTERIDRLILMGAYPFSSADSMIDDYVIPDELDEMQGSVYEDDTGEDGTEDEIGSRSLDIESSDTDIQYIHAVLWDQSKSLFIQQTIQDYFSEEADAELRTAFVRKAYGWGWRDVEVEGIPILRRRPADWKSSTGLSAKAEPLQAAKNGFTKPLRHRWRKKTI